MRGRRIRSCVRIPCTNSLLFFNPKIFYDLILISRFPKIARPIKSLYKHYYSWVLYGLRKFWKPFISISIRSQKLMNLCEIYRKVFSAGTHLNMINLKKIKLTALETAAIGINNKRSIFTGTRDFSTFDQGIRTDMRTTTIINWAFVNLKSKSYFFGKKGILNVISILISFNKFLKFGLHRVLAIKKIWKILQKIFSVFAISLINDSWGFDVMKIMKNYRIGKNCRSDQ